MQNQNIDHGNKFDWGKTSADYARFRDIYPPQFYEMILNRNCGAAGQRVLDVGTGTGVLPRNLYAAGAHWTGCDIAPNQIAQAKQLSQGMEIAYLVSTAETLPTFAEPFDWITACQCYWYFDVAKTAPAFARVLKSGGKVLLLCHMKTRLHMPAKSLFYNTIRTGAEQGSESIRLQLQRNGLMILPLPIKWKLIWMYRLHGRAGMDA